MNNSETYYIGEMETKDANSLQQLMASNMGHFGKFLPVTLSQNQTVEQSEAYISKKATENNAKTSITFAIKEKSNDAVAGLIIIKNIDITKNQGELAFGVGKDFEGRGWATAAVREMTNYVSKSLGLKSLQIITHKTNVGSCKVAEKSGFLWKRTLNNEFTPPNGKPMDMELYELNLSYKVFKAL